MDRKQFLHAGLGGAALLAGAALSGGALAKPAKPAAKNTAKRARAITMWDFSWLERRWDGAGYENWDVALDELCARGYDAVRIDAYPHLVANGAERQWTLLPQWNTQDWGSPDVNRVQVLPALLEFIRKCRARHVKVALSTWYREDSDKTRLKITSPEVMADQWLVTLKAIEQAGLLDTLLYVDLCNEWPLFLWTPFFPGQNNSGDWKAPDSLAWMAAAIARVRARHPDLPLLFSFFNDRVEDYLDADLSHFDLFEHHLWMAQANGGEYYKEVGYDYERFDAKGYTQMSLNAERVYRARPAYWQGLLNAKIDRLAAVAGKLNKPLVTTECWGVVDYKDWPLLKWDWVKDLCAVGTRRAAGSGQWLAVATSNFCGPQFKGMWRDVAYHRELTDAIKRAPIQASLRQGRLWERL